MNTRHFLGFILLFVIANCAYAQSFEKKEGIYAPIEASLSHVNQKVASHFLITDIPDGFNEDQYKKAVQEVCYSNPICKSQSQAIFDSYGVSARKVGDMFSVMICDKENKWKIMEDFSCNNMRVEIQSWKNEDQVPCKFEDSWERIKLEYCM
jgi:hypothetical protein